MKKAVLITSLLCVSLFGWSIQPKPQQIRVKQSDGTTLLVRARGEGHVAFYVTSDGLPVRRNAQGDYCYLLSRNGKLVMTDVIAHEQGSRTSAELSYLTSNQADHATMYQMDRRSPIRHEAKATVPQGPRRISAASTSDGLGQEGLRSKGAVPSLGSYTIPVIMVEFTDAQFNSSHTQSSISQMYNQEGYTAGNAQAVGSVHDYFVDNSNGLFSPSFDVVAKVRVDKSYTYYGENMGYDPVTRQPRPLTDEDGDGYDRNMITYELFTDAVNAAIAQGVNFNKFVHEGGVPNVAILYAGEGEATSWATHPDADNLLWPFEVDINRTVQGVRFNSVFFGNELDSNQSLMGIGTFVHEFSHGLGMPDVYCTDYSHDVSPMGYWDVMDAGNYVKDGWVPIGYTAYERSFMGWKAIDELTTEASVTLYPHGSTQGANAALVRNPSDAREYFIIENRAPERWNPSPLNGGALITHVTYDESLWKSNDLNNIEDELRICYLPSSGTRKDNQKDGVLWPIMSDVTQSFTTTSKSAMTLFDGTPLDKPFYNIRWDDATTTVHFDFLKDPMSSSRIEGDVDGDGAVTITDAIKIVYKVLGKDSSAKQVLDELLDAADPQ